MFCQEISFRYWNKLLAYVVSRSNTWEFKPCWVPAVHGVMGCSQRSCKLVWRCHQPLSGLLAKDHLPRVLRQSRRSLMIRLILKWSQRLCTDLLEFDYDWGETRKTSTRKQSDEGSVTSHCLKWSPLHQNEVGVITQYVRKGQERNEGKKERMG